MKHSHDTEKGSSIEQERHQIEEVALAGHAATDIHGHSLVAIDAKAEAALRWKIDIRIMPTIALLYLFCFIDRANIGKYVEGEDEGVCASIGGRIANMMLKSIGSARLAGLEMDLKMTGKYDYNILLTAFYVAYVVFEIPCNYICKIVGPGKFIPILSFFFGLFSFAMAFVKTFGAGFALRFLLGVAEAGVFPNECRPACPPLNGKKINLGISFYLSRWCRKDEFGFRLALYIVCAPLAGAFGGLLASGLLKAPSFGTIHTWRMIFFAEGIITMGIAVISYPILTDRPETAKWLSAEEKALCAARTKSENVGSIVVVDEAKTKVFISGMFNMNSLVNAFIFSLGNITVQGLAFFLPTIIKTIFPRNSTVELQLRTEPPYIVGAVVSLVLPYLSWKTGRRAFWMTVSAPLMIIGYAMFVASTNPQVRYASCFLIASGAFSFGSFCNTWAAINTTSDTARAGAIAITVFGGNLGGLVATWSYLSRSRRDEGRMDHVLVRKSDDEIAMLGQQHPGFRYRH
ncbi:BZ3500_MvSof-1268-A1-R1_Chr3-1g06151 [Microbotryum saponariae]|uniref:BZ3500_MvSof-1268-A1-R1_Chr3-1g06151 protein n=1 Tax=Microbotryum saponariae TaxID=289078 RepID=A0A2X0LAV5_9BASI|nr:BZ3500_MvSof-1268-A1-R1_Chr3-1g06151 [Microbotryum saponariae]SDA04014.1 BZ3501_MvSof-1269-A2-R1_Chr3-2g05836 [Microbotryum saponariae]